MEDQQNDLKNEYLDRYKKRKKIIMRKYRLSFNGCSPAHTLAP